MTIQRGFGLTTKLLVILTLACATSWAQFTSAIEGTVSDPSGAVVPGATVTIRNEETGVVQTSQSSAAGYYRFPSLSSSSYNIRVSLSGFSTFVQENFRLQVAQTRTLNVTLEVGATETEISVTADVPVIETSEGRVSGHIEEAEVSELPLTGRNFFKLVVLIPGVTGLASGGGQSYAQATGDIFNNEFGVNMNANGARAESNHFLVDSASASSSQRNGVTNINPNSEMVQEVRVSVNNFSAEFGRNSAALVNVITKQGTNALHGSAAWFHTNNEITSRNTFQAEVPIFRRNEIIWGLGGPIKRDRTFFFGSMDILRSGVATGRAASVVTPQFIDFMKANHPNNTSTFIMDEFRSSVTPTGSFVTAGDQVGVTCPNNASDPISTPLGMMPCNLPIRGVGAFNTTLPRDAKQWSGRIDHTFNDSKDRLFGSVTRSNLDQILFGSPFVYPDFNTLQPSNSLLFNTNWTRTVSPTFVNEFGFSYVRVFGDALVNRPEVPGISVTGIEGYQTGWGPNAFVQNNFEWRDVASLTHGSHSLKIGGSYTYERADHESARVFNRPIFNFQSVFDFGLDNAFSHSNVGFDPRTGERLNELFSLIRTGAASAFIQDDWKIAPNFTLNLGLRWENFFNPSDAECSTCIANMTFPAGDDFNSRIANAIMQGQDGLLDSGFHTFSPRVSFAWDPTREGKMSIRAGAGIFYDRISNQLYDGEFTNPPEFAQAAATLNDPVTKPRFGLGATSDPPYNYQFPINLQSGLDERNGLLNGRANVVAVDPDLDPARITNWFFGIQRQLGNEWMVEGNYIGSAGRHLYTRFNVNRFSGDLIMNRGNFTGLQPGFAAINLGQSRESSVYHGATAAVKKRFSSGLLFESAYTYGKAIDQSSRLDANVRADVFDGRRLRGLADFDIRHKLAISAIWELPSPGGSGALNKVFGGWQATTVTVLQTSPPFSVICTQAFRAVFDDNGNVVGNTGCDFNADGTNFDFPNTPSFGNSLDDLSKQDYLSGIFTRADFPSPALGRQGDLGRNTFHGPGFANVDFSVMKNLAFTERVNMQFRTEFFNLFNRVNLSNVEGNMNSGLFGRSGSAFAARNIQLGLRLSF